MIEVEEPMEFGMFRAGIHDGLVGPNAVPPPTGHRFVVPEDAPGHLVEVIAEVRATGVEDMPIAARGS